MAASQDPPDSPTPTEGEPEAGSWPSSPVPEAGAPAPPSRLGADSPQLWPPARMNDSGGHIVALLVVMPIAMGTLAIFSEMAQRNMVRMVQGVPLRGLMWLVVTVVAWGVVVALARATPRGRILVGLLYGVLPLVLALVDFRLVLQAMGALPDAFRHVMFGVQVILFPVSTLIAVVFTAWGVLDRGRPGL